MKTFRPFSTPFRPAAVIISALVAFIGSLPDGSLHAEDHTLVLKAAHLFDGKSKTLLSNGVVVVQGDKIVDAGSNLPVPADAQVIDLGDATLSPGFIDAHTHLTFDYSGDYNKNRLAQISANVSEHAIRATSYARATIEAGF